MTATFNFTLELRAFSTRITDDMCDAASDAARDVFDGCAEDAIRANEARTRGENYDAKDAELYDTACGSAITAAFCGWPSIPDDVTFEAKQYTWSR